jgi:hypothetical protein
MADYSDYGIDLFCDVVFMIVSRLCCTKKFTLTSSLHCTLPKTSYFTAPRSLP